MVLRGTLTQPWVPFVRLAPGPYTVRQGASWMKSAVLVEHRVFHPGAGVPVRTALRPGRDELIGSAFGLDVEGTGERWQSRPAGCHDGCRDDLAVFVSRQALRGQRDHDELALCIRGRRRSGGWRDRARCRRWWYRGWLRGCAGRRRRGWV